MSKAVHLASADLFGSPGVVYKAGRCTGLSERTSRQSTLTIA